MKRILTLFLALILVLSLGVTALATGYTGDVAPLNVILVNAATGEVLYSKAENDDAYSAGLVKLMTAYVTVKSIDDLDTVVTVSKSAFSTLDPDDFTLYPMLTNGEEITVRDLLGAMLVASSSDAALALAQYVGGSVNGFVEYMNNTAADLGMTNTKYTNPAGKHHGKQCTTAADLAILAAEILKYPELMDIFSGVSYTIPATNKADERTVYNTNRLICEYSDEECYLYDHATGMIAGYTYYAGGCLAATAEKDGTELICIILGDISSDHNERWTLAADLFDYGFSLYAPTPAGEILGDIPLTYTGEDGTEYTVEADFTDITVSVDTADGITAAVSSEDGQTGTAVYTDSEGGTVAEVPVTLTAAVAEPEPEPAPAPEPEVPSEVPEEEPDPEETKDGKSSAKLLLAIAISVVILAAAAFAANTAVKKKAGSKHASESDSFKVKFRHNFMTWLLFGIIAVILIVIVFIILI